jgi:hypothetical protein
MKTIIIKIFFCQSILYYIIQRRYELSSNFTFTTHFLDHLWWTCALLEILWAAFYSLIPPLHWLNDSFNGKCIWIITSISIYFLYPDFEIRSPLKNIIKSFSISEPHLIIKSPADADGWFRLDEGLRWTPIQYKISESWLISLQYTIVKLYCYIVCSYVFSWVGGSSHQHCS